MAHSVEVYIPLPTNRSPFNVGMALELPTFNQEQVQDLAQRHQLPLTTPELEQLMKLTGGFPYLIRLALYQSSRLNIHIKTFLQDATIAMDIYQKSFQYLLWTLQQNPQLAEAFQQVLTAPTQLDMEATFKLESLGLVQIIENQLTVSCELYRDYFRSLYDLTSLP
jgi:hypothetical protein